MARKLVGINFLICWPPRNFCCCQKWKNQNCYKLAKMARILVRNNFRIFWPPPQKKKSKKSKIKVDPNWLKWHDNWSKIFSDFLTAPSPHFFFLFIWSRISKIKVAPNWLKLSEFLTPAPHPPKGEEKNCIKKLNPVPNWPKWRKNLSEITFSWKPRLHSQLGTKKSGKKSKNQSCSKLAEMVRKWSQLMFNQPTPTLHHHIQLGNKKTVLTRLRLT